MEKISFDELRELLKKLGHSDEEIEEAVKSFEKEEAPEDEVKEEVKVEVESEPTPEEGSDAEDGSEETPSDDVPPSDESEPESGESSDVEPPVDEEVPSKPVDEVSPVEDEVPPAEGEPLPEGVSEVDPDAPVPAVDETPTEPVQSDVDVQALLSQIEEYKKSNDGLLARLEAMESALKEAGVLGEGAVSSKPVGVDDGTRVNDYHDDEETFDNIINEINRGY